jgi:hypothetical protein
MTSDLELLLAEAPGMPHQLFERLSVAILTRLYAAGLMLPSPSDIIATTGGPEAWERCDPTMNPGHDRWMEVWRANYERLASYLGERDRYFEVMDPDVPESLTTTLSDDLADVLADLMAGAVLCDQSRVPEGLWEWRLGFGHWGAHAVSAMKVLHARIDWDEA